GERHRRLLGVASHASIHAFDGRLDEWRALRARALARGDVAGAAPFVEDRGMAFVDDPAAGGAPVGLVIRGIDPELEPSVARLGGLVTAGSIDALEPRSVRNVLEIGRAPWRNAGYMSR